MTYVRGKERKIEWKGWVAEKMLYNTEFSYFKLFLVRNREPPKVEKFDHGASLADHGKDATRD